MPLIIGIFIIPLIILIINKSNLVTTKKKHQIMLNILLILICIIYIVFCFEINLEPFKFEEQYSKEYMIYTGRYILYSGIIFAFTPFMWIVLAHFLKMLFKSIRIRKNAIIKKKEEYLYYRDDLDKISPSIIMFTSTFEVDMKKSISATILKLKLAGYIKQENERYIYTNKDETDLLESEKLILKMIRFNSFDKNEYKKVIEKETLNRKYIVKNKGGKLFRKLKIIIAIVIPILVSISSIQLDEYTFKNYHIWPENDGHVYIELKIKEDKQKLFEEVENKKDYSVYMNDDGSYIYKYARADKLEYSIVRKACFLNLLTAFIIGFIIVFYIISLYIIIEQIIYFNKNYRRTIKGKILINKAYALKNYLKDYSLIKDKTEEELILWEYYLIYAVILDVNAQINDNIIEKYVNKSF